MAFRSTPHRGKSKRAFAKRASQTHRMNKRQPQRGGIRL